MSKERQSEPICLQIRKIICVHAVNRTVGRGGLCIKKSDINFENGVVKVSKTAITVKREPDNEIPY
ncbi:hypothetical protein ACPW7J_06220 [Ihubacter sp. rT4E-8]|uniref:hypothetical protein n=1 Tax=Ihubacter sp. rT4E-8 TaxID=3242369 RepID=UPI003CED86E3